MQLEEYMTRIEWAKEYLGVAFEQGQWDGDINDMTVKEIIEAADHLESKADYLYDQWKERYNE